MLTKWLKGMMVYLADLEAPDAVGCKLLHVGQGDRDGSVSLGASRRPVLVTLDPRPFFQLGHHHDGGGA